MRISFAISLYLLITCAYTQDINTSGQYSSHKSLSLTAAQYNTFSTVPKQKILVTKGNIVFTSYNLLLSPIENEISELEASECDAVLYRDTSALKNIWARDFTLDRPLDKIFVNGKNPLPYYVSLRRMVENSYVVDNAIYTSGHESFQILKPNGEIGGTGQREYFHVWTRTDGVWKLSTNVYNE